MKIVILNYEYPPVGGGGGEVSKYLAEEYAAKKHEVTVITSHWGNLPKQEVLKNVKIVRHFAFRKGKDRSNIVRMILYFFSSIVPVIKHTKRLQPDVVHVHFAVPCGPMGYMLNRILGIPYLITLHGGNVPSAAAYMSHNAVRVFKVIKPLLKPILKRASRVVPVSKGLLEMAQKDFPYLATLTYLPNGVDIAQFHPAREAHQGEKHLVRLVFAGRFQEQKNLPSLIKALHRVAEDTAMPEWEMLLFGDGPDRQLIESMIDKYTMHNRILLKGWVNRDELAEHLRNADVFILPSKVEGMPIAALQAMASGLPLIGSDVVGINEVVIDGRCGVLVPSGNVETLKDAICDLIRSPAKREAMSIEARKHVEEHYAWEPIADSYLNLFKSIIKKRETAGR